MLGLQIQIISANLLVHIGIFFSRLVLQSLKMESDGQQLHCGKEKLKQI
jgi:hypothetical protein